MNNLYTSCGHEDAHAGKAWLVDCCCLSAVCQSWLFHFCIFDRFRLNIRAICVHVVGMWKHMLAKLCWWIVVACRWFVKCGFIGASMIGLC